MDGVILLVSGVWPGLAGALGLGLGCGFVGGWPRGLATGLGLLSAASLLGAAALAGLVPGVGGFWVESAALMLWTYLGGCVLGALTKRARRDHQTANGA
ncbi:hypothetical protein [Methylobacterium durans]|uniref:hypothetical protein n=1 Tax=Methylobacterium durans TaxID=2202825 RepID=UPI001F48BE8B|nr:hypothetical protein [Methylobacterium durans]